MTQGCGFWRCATEVRLAGSTCIRSPGAVRSTARACRSATVICIISWSCFCSHQHQIAAQRQTAASHSGASMQLPAAHPLHPIPLVCVLSLLPCITCYQRVFAPSATGWLDHGDEEGQGGWQPAVGGVCRPQPLEPSCDCRQRQWHLGPWRPVGFRPACSIGPPGAPARHTSFMPTPT